MNLAKKPFAAPSPWCCICHDPSDAGWAACIAEQLSAYAIPPRLVGRVNPRGEIVPARIHPVSAITVPRSGEINPEDAAALERSRYLVIVCSRDAATSDTISEQIRRYKAAGKSDRLLAAVIEGAPNGTQHGQPTDECFPLALRHEIDADGDIVDMPAEPLAADFRIHGRDPAWYDIKSLEMELRKAGVDNQTAREHCEDARARLPLMKLKLIAGIIGVNLGELTERDKLYQAETAARRARQARNRALILGALGLAAAGATAYAWDSQRKRRQAENLVGQTHATATQLATVGATVAAQASEAEAGQFYASALQHLEGLDGGERNRPKAISLLRQAADMSHRPAQLRLGQMLIESEPGSEDLLDGIELIRAAAKKGHEPAIDYLAGLYEEGKALSQSKPDAVRLAQQAADLGYAPAMARLGYMLERGWGGAGRIKEGFSWYEKAADLNDGDGHFALYNVYGSGRKIFGVARDVAKSEEHLKRAADAGCPRAIVVLANQMLAALPRGESPEAAIRMLTRGAESGDPACARALGQLFLTGKSGVPVNPAQAERWLTRAAESGDILAAKSLSRFYESGKQPERQEDVRKWMRFAADRGDAEACYLHAKQLMLSEPGKFGYESKAATPYLLKAAKGDHTQAQYEYGDLVLRNVISGSHEEAVTWIDKAASKSHREAMWRAGDCRLNGKGIAKDVDTGKELLRRAATLGAAGAKRMLEEFEQKEALSDAAKIDLAGARAILAKSKPSTEELRNALAALEPKNEADPEDLLAAAEQLARSEMSGMTKNYSMALQDRMLKSLQLLPGRLLVRMTRVKVANDSYYNYKEGNADYLLLRLAVATDGDPTAKAELARMEQGRIEKQVRQFSDSMAGMCITGSYIAAAAKRAMDIEPERMPSMLFRRRYGRPVEPSDAELKRAETLLKAAESTKNKADYTAAMKAYFMAVRLDSDKPSPAIAAGLWCANATGSKEATFLWQLLAANASQPAATDDIMATVAYGYAAGEGAPVDRIEALKWLMLAKRTGGSPPAAARAYAKLGPITKQESEVAAVRVACHLAFMGQR